MGEGAVVGAKRGRVLEAVGKCSGRWGLDAGTEVTGHLYGFTGLRSARARR